MSTAIRVAFAALLGGCAISLLLASANAETFDLSTLNVNSVTGPRPPHFPICPCTDPVTGAVIFGNQTNAQSNGWTEGTDGLAATLYFMGDGRGNNAGKIYLPSGGPLFPIPSGESLGNNNTQGTGDFAQGNGFPLYFWFGPPGNTATTPATGVAIFLNSFYIAGASGITVTGYSDLGITVADSMVVPNNSGVERVTLNWSGIEQLSFTGGSGFYVNDIEVNDVPGPIVGAGLPGLIFAGGLLGWWRRKRAGTAALAA